MRLLICALGVAVLLPACQRAKASRADLGPEVSAQELNAIFGRATAGPAPRARVGQFVRYSHWRTFANGGRVVETGRTSAMVVAGTHEHAGTSRFRVKVEKAARLADGSFNESTSEDSFAVESKSRVREPTSAAEADFSVPAEGVDLASAVVEAKEAEGAAHKVSFHHLREFDRTIQFEGKPGDWPVHFVHFEMVRWISDNDYRKIGFDLGFCAKTPRVPFGAELDRLTGTLVADCRGAAVHDGARRIFVRDCRFLEEFKE